MILFFLFDDDQDEEVKIVEDEIEYEEYDLMN